MRRITPLLAILLSCVSAFGGEARPPATRPVRRPPPMMTPAEKEEVGKLAAEIGARIVGLRRQHAENPNVLALLPDVQIYYNALHYPVMYGETCDIKKARAAHAAAVARCEALERNTFPWVFAGGPRGYVSKLDGAVIPYVIGVPKGSELKNRRYRLDFFCHGRDENLTELNFISQKTPEATTHFILHPYGRFCNANKFAGEVDTLEAFEHVKASYPIDEDRVVMTGFSMGGGTAWHLTAHYGYLFCASSPGAGFAETPHYSKLLNRLETIPWYEQALWKWYDATEYAANFANVPTVAYAGETDPQIQASDVMGRYMKEEGLTLERMIGPGTGHSYHKETKQKLDARLAELAAKGRDPRPAKIRFTTYTLRYNRWAYLSVDGLEEHWKRARVELERKGDEVTMTTSGVTALMLDVPARRVTIDGNAIQAAPTTPLYFHKDNGVWKPAAPDPSPRKRPGAQGPIDDAFMDSFLFVRPTGTANDPAIDAFTRKQIDAAVANWRKTFRGEARVKDDSAVTAEDIAHHNLICFGDPASNAIIAKVLPKLPIAWTADEVKVAGKSYAAKTHLPAMIYPNPLSPGRYVVLNSGFTCPAWPVSNARQTPMLPDWAVYDITKPGSSANYPAAVVDANFFDERWQFKK